MKIQELNNGDLFFGELVEDKREGKGILLVKNKSIYVGDWKDNHPDLMGMHVRSKSTLFQNKKKNFNFEFLHQNSDSFVSYFKSNNQLIGLFKYQNLIIRGWIESSENPLKSSRQPGFYERSYRGRTELGTFDERGVLSGCGLIQTNDYKYFGQVDSGMFQGIGVLEDFSNKNVYLSNFKQNQFQDFTIIFMNNCLVFRMLRNMKNVGLVYYTRNRIYFGEILIKNKKIVKNGFGCYFFDGCDYYRGHWMDNKRHGVGQEVHFDKNQDKKTIKKSNQEKWQQVIGFLRKFVVAQKNFHIFSDQQNPSFNEKFLKISNYFGEWSKDKKHGEGLLIQGKKQYKGLWNQNIFVKEIDIGQLQFFINNQEIELVEESQRFIERNISALVKQKKDFVNELHRIIKHFH